MPEVVSCPHCERKLRVPDTLVGKQVRCPACKKPFSAAVPPKPAPMPARKKEESIKEDDENPFEVLDEPPRRRATPTEDEDEEPRRRRRRHLVDDDEDEEQEEDERPSRRRRRRLGAGGNWPSIHKGLTLILTAVIVSIAAAVVLPILAMVIGGTALAVPTRQGVAAAGAGIIFIGILSLVVSLVRWGLALAGRFFCLPSPEEHSAKTLALLTLICYGGSAAFSLLVNVVGFVTGGAGALGNPFAAAAGSALNVVLAVLVVLLVIADFFIFLFYLRALALIVNADWLASNIIKFMITAVVAPIVYVLLSCVGALVMGAGLSLSANPQGGGPSPAAGLLAGGIVGILCVGLAVLVALGLLIWWIMLLVQVRAAVASHMARR